MLWYRNILFYFESVRLIVNQRKIRFWQVSQSFDYLTVRSNQYRTANSIASLGPPARMFMNIGSVIQTLVYQPDQSGLFKYLRQNKM